MQTPTNWFVFNLAVCDVIIVLFPIPYVVLDQYIEWPFKMIGCKYLVMPTMEMFAGVCVLTHTAISFARYAVISKIKVNMALGGRRLTKIFICLIWCLCFLILSVTIMGEFEMDENEKKCMMKWSSDEKQQVYRISVLLLIYVGPMLLTGYSYYKIHNIVDKSFHHVDGFLPYDMLISRRRKKQQMDRMLTVMYFMFAITTLPYHVLMLLWDFKQIEINDDNVHVIRNTYYLVLNVFYVQILTNPCVLLYMGDEYKKELRKLRIYCCMSRDEARILLQSSVRTTCTEVDRNGTFRKRKEPCYDIMVSTTGNVSLYNEALPWNEQFECTMGNEDGGGGGNGINYNKSDSVPLTEYTYYDDEGSPFLDRSPSMMSSRRRSSGKVLNNFARTKYAHDYVDGLSPDEDGVTLPYNIDRRRSSAKSKKGVAKLLVGEDEVQSPYKGDRRRSSAKSNKGIAKILAMEYKENYTEEELKELDEQVSLFSRRRSSIRKKRKDRKNGIAHNTENDNDALSVKYGDKMVYPKTKLIKNKLEPSLGAIVHIDGQEKTEKSSLLERTLLNRRRNSPSVLNIDIHINTKVVIGKNKVVTIDENNNTRSLFTIPELRNSLIFENEEAQAGVYVSHSERSSIIVVYDPDRETIL